MAKRPAAAAKAVSAAQRAQLKQQRRQQRRRYATAVGAATVAGAAVSAGGAIGAGSQEQMDALSNQLASLQEAAALADIYGDLEDTDTALATLPTEVEAVRSQGYAFANYLERKVQVLTDQWAEMRQQVTEAIDRRSVDLQQDMSEAERALQAAYSGGGAAVGRAENAIRQLESKVAAAQDTIEGMYDTIDENVTQVLGQLEEINWTLDMAREASFDFYEGEDFVAACRAQMIERDDEGPEGILHLTDERIAFEQKEEIATKKVLFITTEKETVHEFVFDELVGHAEEIKASEARKGLIGKKEMIEILFSPEADISEVQLRLIHEDSAEWAQLINRVKTGEIEQERVRVEGAEGEEETAAGLAVQVEEIPSKCPNCGALLTTPIVRGMREINCEYCTTTIRL